MNILRETYRCIRNLLRSQNQRYIPYIRIIPMWLKNRKTPYSIINLEQAKQYKKSNTIFILGSGPSINDLTREQWDVIRDHDSFGINFSHLLDFPTTFYSLEDGHTAWFRNFVEEKFKSYRKKFSSVIWCISDKHIGRFIHPVFAPGFFPENPTCWYYKFPAQVRVNENQSFSRSEFEKKSIIYRGSLSTVLYLIDKLEYKRIVLLGIDLDTPEHFFYGMKEMEKYVKKQQAEHDKDKFIYMVQKKGKMRPFDEYLCALVEQYFRPKGVILYMGTKDKVIYPRMELYPW